MYFQQNCLIVFNALTSIRFALYKSQRSCRLIQKSSETPKNFESRKAVLGVIPRRLLTISFILWYGTCISFDNSLWVIPIGIKNSSRSISPGCVGTRCVGTRIISASKNKFFFYVNDSQFSALSSLSHILNTVFFTPINYLLL